MSNTVLPFHSEHLNFILHLSEFTRVWLIFFHNKSRSRTTYRNTTQLKPNICAFRSFHDRQIIFFSNNFNSSICWVKFVEVFLEWYTSPVSVTLVRIFGKIRNKRKIYIYVNIYRERITCTSICNHLKNTDIVTSLILPILPSSTLFWLRFFFWIQRVLSLFHTPCLDPRILQESKFKMAGRQSSHRLHRGRITTIFATKVRLTKVNLFLSPLYQC